MSHAQQIAQTILHQLGGNKFAVMTGAKNFGHSTTDGRTSLSMKVGRNAKRVSHVRITLDPSDTYTMTSYSARGKEIASDSMIYDTDLQRFFTKQTGLYTHL